MHVSSSKTNSNSFIKCSSACVAFKAYIGVEEAHGGCDVTAFGLVSEPVRVDFMLSVVENIELGPLTSSQ